MKTKEEHLEIIAPLKDKQTRLQGLCVELEKALFNTTIPGSPAEHALEWRMRSSKLERARQALSQVDAALEQALDAAEMDLREPEVL